MTVKSFKPFFILTLAMFVLLLGLVNVYAKSNKPKYEIKFATLAPDGSTWMNIMRSLDEEVRAATNGEVGFKIYPGGVQGDEVDVIRKMRYGQLHAAGFTGNGLGEIQPAFRILDMPFLYNNKEEIDYITDRFFDRFDQLFREKGFVLLGFAEVGYVYAFSKKPVYSFEDLRKQKMWSWQGDPLAEVLFAEMGISPVPLSVTDVTGSLDTPMLDAVYTSPYAAVSLQWHTRVKYMNNFPMVNSNGAVLIQKKLFDQIPPEYQKKLLAISREKLRELTLASRKDNEDALSIIEKSGVTILPGPDEAEQQRLREVGERVRQKMTGEMYSAELLNDIMAALEEFRSNQGE